MAKIHVGRPNGEHTELDEEEVREKCERGDFEPGTLFWKKGMSEWQPISEFTSYSVYQPAAQPVPHLQPQHQHRQYTYQDIGTLTMVATVLFGVGVIIDGLSIFSNIARIELLSREYTVAEGQASDDQQQLLGIIELLVWLVTLIFFLRWVHRANANCRALGAPMRFTPGWCVGYYFIPILNFFRPYQAMHDTWTASHDSSGEIQASAGWVGLWWALWLLHLAAGQIVGTLAADSDTIGDLRTVAEFSIGASCLATLMTLVLIKVILTICSKQRHEYSLATRRPPSLG